jgi:ATP-binding cassette subfamily B protein
MAHPLTRLFGHAQSYRKHAAVASLFSVMNKIFDVLPEVLIGVAVDVVVSKKDSFLAKAGVVDPQDQLLLLAGITVVVWMCESLFEYLYALGWRNLAQSIQHDLRMDAYRHVQSLELSWFEQRRTGNLMSILSEDINQLERFLNGGANDLIQVLTSTLLVSGVFFVLAPEVAGLALLPVPLIIYGAFWFQSRLAQRYAKVRDNAGTLNARLNNNLLGIATIKAYAAEDYEAQRIEEVSRSYKESNGEAIRFSAAITPVSRMAILAGFTVTLLYGGFMALRGELGVGSYSVLVYLTQRLLWPMTRLADMSDLYQRSMASVDRVMNLLETPVGITYAGKPLGTRSISGSLALSNVNFAYAETPTLQNISVKIQAGKTCAFVGSTGSGKSTLVKLLLRFYEPGSGRIVLDGEALDSIALQDLRRTMGYVAQDSFLTDASVAENIAYGLAQPRRTRLSAPCHRATIPRLANAAKSCPVGSVNALH